MYPWTRKCLLNFGSNPDPESRSRAHSPWRTFMRSLTAVFRMVTSLRLVRTFYRYAVATHIPSSPCVSRPPLLVGLYSSCLTPLISQLTIIDGRVAIRHLRPAVYSSSSCSLYLRFSITCVIYVHVMLKCKSIGQKCSSSIFPGVCVSVVDRGFRNLVLA